LKLNKYGHNTTFSVITISRIEFCVLLTVLLSVILLSFILLNVGLTLVKLPPLAIVVEATTAGAIFATLHFHRNLQIDPIN
jgi:hypothetical protein